MLELDKNKAGEAAPRNAPRGGNNISASVSAERRDAGDHEYRSELDMGYCSSANSYYVQLRMPQEKLERTT
ncbi:hypothetical protein RB195_001559 [Necator americanus]|uniref:Uncharacterized protein n=1 Tax=Necator americanus TaxID=51031 RepID=A0ABR1DG26_NECAM